MTNIWIVDYFSPKIGQYVYLHGGFVSEEKAKLWLDNQLNFERSMITYVYPD